MGLLADPATHDVVHLVGGPYVSARGTRHEVPEGSKRLLAFVALRHGRVERRHAAGTLWPTGGDGRAAGNLRSALWRLRGAGIEVLIADKWSLSLAPGVAVDVDQLCAWANRLINGAAETADLEMARSQLDALDLLPGWYDDWAIMERERVRQRILHAFEALSRELSRRARHADAVEAAMIAIDADPLRESAHRTLIEVHLAEGNWVEANRRFSAYRTILRDELGVAPSRELITWFAANSDNTLATAAAT